MSTAKDLLLLTGSQTEQKRWVSHLLKRIPKHPTLSPPPTAQNSSCSSPQISPRPSPKSSPHMSHRGAIKIQASRQQQSPGKPRWETSWEILILKINVNFPGYQISSGREQTDICRGAEGYRPGFESDSWPSVASLPPFFLPTFLPTLHCYVTQ